MSVAHNRRILLIDDMLAIHDDFRKILIPDETTEPEMDEIEAMLFGEEKKKPTDHVELDSAYQGQEGLQKVHEALQNSRPYALAFVDMRMPPGWDGVETIEHLWQKDPDLQIVICTAYSDYSWEDMLRKLDARDRLLILKKPFDKIEVSQLVSALTAKWEMTKKLALQMNTLEETVRQRTHEITQANKTLSEEIVERKRLESQMVQSEKLASIGQLAAGVAHEINNPIGYIFSNLNALEKYFSAIHSMLSFYRGAEPYVTSIEIAEKLIAQRELLEIDFLMDDTQILIKESKEGAERVRLIVQDMKDFSRIESSQTWQSADLHAGINSTLNIIANEIKYRADVVKNFGELPNVQCLPSQLNQVFMNLLINSAQAMDAKRGTITISTGADTENVWITIADSGCGISEKNISLIFDPFFTTKPIGKGTGLGLSLSYGIVKKHNGKIEVKSEIGKGTAFHITLPILHAEESA